MVTCVKDWVVKFGGTRNIYGNKKKKKMHSLSILVKEENEHTVHGDSRMSLVIEKGKVHLKLTSGEVLILSNVLYVSNICWNLVSVSLLRKARAGILLDSDKIILIKNDAFVRKGCCIMVSLY